MGRGTINGTVAPGEYEDFGNFNYGATGAALGIPGGVLLLAAGLYQVKSGTSTLDWVLPNGLGPQPWQFPFASFPFGDDPKDQIMIMEGIEYAKHGCKCQQ